MAQVAVLVQAVVLAQDLVQVAAVEAAAARDRDQGPEVERDLEQAQEQDREAAQDTDRVAAMALDRAADRGQGADTDLALVLDRERAGSLAMASAFISGATSIRNGLSCTRLVFRLTIPHFFAAVLVQSQAQADSMGK